MISTSNNIMLTVIVPVFNTEKYLERCLDSILNQSFEDIEILIVNDQSSDNSRSIAEGYAKKWENIKLFDTTTRALAGGCRNIGLYHAKGKYIGFVDSDDWIDSGMYWRIISILEKTNADIAVCGVAKEYEHPSQSFYKYVYQNENVIDGAFAFELLAQRNNMDIAISPIVCNKVYRSDFLLCNGINFLENNYNEDDVFNYQCLLNARRVAIVPEIYYHYFQRSNSITHTFSKKHIDDVIIAFITIKEYLISKNLFEKHKHHFYAYFERSLSFVLNLLITKEHDQVIQNTYLQHLLSSINGLISITDYFDYCGASRVRYFFNPLTIR